MKRWMSTIVLVALVLCVVGCDGATKRVARDRLEGKAPVELVSGVLDLRYVENRGAAFNAERVLPQRWGRHVIVLVRLLLVPLLVFVWIRRRPGWWGEVGFALLVGGALGNLVDTVVRGFVVDFVHLAHWPVFNVADVAILMGMVLVVLRGQRVALAV